MMGLLEKVEMTRGPEPDTTFVNHSLCGPTTLLTLKKYSWFHIIFVLGAMYVAMLLTDWWVYRSLWVFLSDIGGSGMSSRK